MQLRTETSVQPNGTIVLHGLPFHEGDKVVVTITAQQETNNPVPPYSLRGLPAEYRDPFEPIAEHDWSLA